MAFVAVDANKAEWIYETKPTRQCYNAIWRCDGELDSMIRLPTGSIARLIGRDLKWEDEPVELT